MWRGQRAAPVKKTHTSATLHHFITQHVNFLSARIEFAGFSGAAGKAPNPSGTGCDVCLPGQFSKFGTTCTYCDTAEKTLITRDSLPVDCIATFECKKTRVKR